jgi:3',5'-cyclic AMP phosphodiesterase CpdA
MRLLAISDLHLAHRANREALARLAHHPDDWLIVAGDVGESPALLVMALEALVPRFARVIWTPGNHDLWCPPAATDRTRGQARYDELVAVCRSFGALTPEDPYPEWPGEPGTFVVPLFLLFDYSFRPATVADGDALAWARESGLFTVGLTGFDGGKVRGQVELSIHFPVKDMEIAENLHLIVVHLVVGGLRRAING